MDQHPIIFSASIGHGHNQAAKAIQHEFESKGIQAPIVDTFQTLHPLLHTCMLKSYIQLLKYGSYVWRKLYFYAEEQPLFLLWDRIGSFFVERLYSIIQQQRCECLISTHPFVTAFLVNMKREKGLDIPLYTVITDFVLHPAYIRHEVNGYFTADPSIEEFASKNHVPIHRFYVTGIPIANDRSLDRSKWKARYELGLQLDKKTLLIAGGGIGLTNYPQVIQTLEQLHTPIQLLCMIGHNHKAKEKIMEIPTKHDVKIIDFTDQFLLYLKASDAILSKAGGLTMAESLACETPIMIYEPVPGHEEHNAQFLMRNGAAVKVQQIEDIPVLLKKMLYQKRYYGQLKENARRLKRPYAAKHIVDEILMLFEQQRAVR